MAVQSPVGDAKIVSTISTFVLNMVKLCAFLPCQTLTEISFHPGRLVFFELSHCTAKKRNYDPLQQKNPRDKVSLQNKVRILNRLIKAGTHQATSCSNTSQQPIVLCVLENFCEKFYHCNRIMSCNKSYKIKSDWICLTCGGNKILLLRQDFHKNSPVHTQSDLSLHRVVQLSTRPVHTQWFAQRLQG